MADPRRGVGGYVNDAVHGGFQIERAERLVREGTLRWVSILVAESGERQRAVVLANRQVVDEWRARLAPLGASVGVTVVHSDDPERDASHYAPWGHVDLAVANAEDVYVEDPTRSKAFLGALGAKHPPLVLSTNGNPAQRPLDYRRWERAGAWLATQAYWQFDVVAGLTPRAAYWLAYLPEQVNVGPSDVAWWYRVWIRGKGTSWFQAVSFDGSRLVLRQNETAVRVRAKFRDGGLYLVDREARDGLGRAGTVIGVFPLARITPHVSNEDGNQGRPSAAEFAARVGESPSRRVAVGVFTLDNATDEELRAIRRACD